MNKPPVAASEVLWSIEGDAWVGTLGRPDDLSHDAGAAARHGFEVELLLRAAWFETCQFQVTPEVDRALTVKGFLVLGVTLICTTPLLLVRRRRESLIQRRASPVRLLVDEL